MWVTKLLISPVKIRIFCPKKSKFGPKMAFLFILGQALPAHLVGGCGARAVSRKTPIYFIFFNSELAVTQIYHVDCIIPRSSGKTVISLGFRAGKHQQRAKCLIVSKWSHLRNRLIRRKCPQSTCTVHTILLLKNTIVPTILLL